MLSRARNLFTSVLAGIVPASGGGTANFLRADATWAAPTGSGGGGSGMNPTYIANNFYMLDLDINVAGNTAVFSTTVTRWFPIWIGAAITISQLGARVTTTSAGGNFQISLYAAGANNFPTGAALGTTPNCSTTTAATVFGTFGSNVVISTPGLYWVGIQCDNVVATFMAQTITYTRQVWQIGASASANLFFNAVQMGTVWTTTGGTYGTWPSTPTITEAAVNTNNLPHVAMKVASVP